MSLFKKKPLLPKQWQTPVSGEIIPLSSLPDQVFAEGMMGAGFAIKATENVITSPINGEVTSVFPGGHALTFVSENGCEFLMHIGIDSVGLKGEGFKSIVTGQQKISIGDPLVEVDFELLNTKLPDSSVIIVFTNIDEGEVHMNTHQLAWKKL